MIASIILWYKHLLLIDSGQKQAKVVASRVTNDLVVTILDKGVFPQMFTNTVKYSLKVYSLVFAQPQIYCRTFRDESNALLVTMPVL